MQAEVSGKVEDVGLIGCLARCGRARASRGLCMRCYMRLYLRVKAGETTWEAEIKAGRAEDGTKKGAVFHARHWPRGRRRK